MLTMKDIIREGHPTLTKRADAVPLPLDADTKRTLKAMRQFLIDSQTPELAEKYALRPGVGLAAPQIDVRLRMLAIYTEDELFENHHDYLMVNPRLKAHTEQLTYMPGGEGCLSIDREVEGLVPRYRQVTVQTRLFDPKTETLSEDVTLKLKGFVSIVFQHELDHLNGILFPTRIKPTLEGVEPVRFKPIESEEEVS
ncbi:MAG: peptide deformylase [Acholeplasmatales bacterium]|nr:MAG: peptide deformylase [Acholeplasmatales bacterium]